MRGVITAPTRLSLAPFTVLFRSLWTWELTVDDVQVETLLGDALGHPKDNFAGKGNHYTYSVICRTRERDGVVFLLLRRA